MDTPNPDTVEAAVVELEGKLGIPAGFLEALLKEDDWSFVIKAHAFLEAAVTHLLVSYTDKPVLSDIFSHLELSNKRTGKIAFAAALDAIDEDGRRFVRSFSEIRNSLVHNVRNIGFTFDTYLASLEAQQKKNLVSAFSYFTDGANFEYEGKTIVTSDFVKGQPKKAAWFSVMVFAGILNEKAGLMKLQTETAALERDIARLSKILGKNKTHVQHGA